MEDVEICESLRRFIIVVSWTEKDNCESVFKSMYLSLCAVVRTVVSQVEISVFVSSQARMWLLTEYYETEDMKLSNINIQKYRGGVGIKRCFELMVNIIK